MREKLAEWLIGDAAKSLEDIHFSFNVPFGQFFALGLLALVGLIVGAYFWSKLSRSKPPSRVFMTALRVATAMLALFLLLDPCLVGKRVLRTDRAVLLLFDDSKSMQVSDEKGRSRGERLQEVYKSVRTDFENQLREKCQIISYRFGESVERVRSPKELNFQQAESDLTGGVASVMAEFQGAQVAAVALFSDGAHQALDRPADIAAVKNLGVPVFSIGVGSDAQWRDLAIGQLSVRRLDFDENPVIVKAQIQTSGMSGEEIVVEAVMDGSVLATSHLKVDGDDARMEARLEFTAQEKGWLELEVRARLAPELASPLNSTADRTPQNNARPFLVDNRERIFRILYLCGRPNWENKFIRRAMEEDDQLKLTSLVRISGAEKSFKYRGNRSNLVNPIFEGTDAAQDAPRYDEALFLRFGAEKSELSKGYPNRAEELFPFHLVVWGEIEAEFFSQEQLDLTREYVRKRGGALLLLGGRHSFTEGGFYGTLIGSILPARLIPSGQASGSTGLDPDVPFQARPTLEGLLSGAWSLDPDAQENRRLWDQMPALYRVNQFAMTRPGATIHAGVSDGNVKNDSRPLFAIQRYGEGRCAALATGSTWQWRMGAGELDRKHERLWRQIVRSQVRESSEPVRQRAKQEVYTTGKENRFEFIVRDALFDEREGLSVTITATAPSGRKLALPAEESIEEAGVYSCEYASSESGLHNLSLIALDDDDQTVGATEQAILQEPDRREFQQAQYAPSFLREISERTGGEFLELSEMEKLPGRISWRPSEKAEEARVHLWRFPPFYFALAILMIVEWALRRRKGYR